MTNEDLIAEVADLVSHGTDKDIEQADFYAAEKIISVVSGEFFSVFDFLENFLNEGCEIKKQDGRWFIFKESGDSLCSGARIRDLMVNLFTNYQ